MIFVLLQNNEAGRGFPTLSSTVVSTKYREIKVKLQKSAPPKIFFLQIFNISGFKGLIYIYYITFKLIISHLTWFSQMLAKELKFALCHSNILQLKNADK